MTYNNKSAKVYTKALRKLYNTSIEEYAPSGNILDIQVTYLPTDDFPVTIIYIVEN